MYLCYKRLSKSDGTDLALFVSRMVLDWIAFARVAGPDVLPITSVLVCVANASGSLHEELPYGYELVKT